MKLFNDLTGKKEELGQQDNYVRMYACGPTVYNFFHAWLERALCAELYGY